MMKAARLRTMAFETARNVVNLEQMLLNQGRIMAQLNRALTTSQIQDFEFTVFSQWGEDGIIQRLIDVVDIKNKTFVEFGVEDFRESNCRFLMMNNNWSGFVIDGSKTNVDRLKRSSYFWKHDLTAINAFITKDNINDLLSQSHFDADVGVLSVDLDGVDFHVLSSIDALRPRILIVEYNAVFGPDRTITVPYDPTFTRFSKHYSGLYGGASLAAFAHLADQRGFALVGTNSAGSNAFFVRTDVLPRELARLSVEDAFTDSKFRESRGRDGNLSVVSGSERLALIAGLPVVNVVTGETETL